MIKTNYLKFFTITSIFVLFLETIAQGQSLSDSGLIIILDNSGSMGEVYKGSTKLV